jgi:TPR repeat protein
MTEKILSILGSGKILTLTTMLLLGTIGSASADYQKGLNAANRGDYITAFAEFYPLAEQGSAPAQYNLGLMHEKLQNYGEAANWYHRAANQFHTDAQNNLGVLYNYGKGVRLDYAQAYMWYSLAAAAGNEYAKRNIDIIIIQAPLYEITRGQQLVNQCAIRNFTWCGLENDW